MGPFKSLTGMSATLIYAVIQMWNRQPCQDKLSCRRTGRRETQTYRHVLRTCWACFSSDEDAQQTALHCLRVCLFACQHGYAKAMEWSQFEYYIDESPMLGIEFQNQLTDWLAENKTKLRRPWPMLNQLLRMPNSVTVAALHHFARLVPERHQEKLHAKLYNLLVAGCHRAWFDPHPQTGRPQLRIQYLKGDPPQTF